MLYELFDEMTISAETFDCEKDTTTFLGVNDLPNLSTFSLAAADQEDAVFIENLESKSGRDSDNSLCKRKTEFVVDECQEKRTRVEAEVNKRRSTKTSDVKQKPDYIHVRARRGEATDNHSISERARREKITRKLKYLQDLVPGCNKITGKAGVLDEIINYVQSLQRQVEFLSMKMAVEHPTISEYNFSTWDADLLSSLHDHN